MARVELHVADDGASAEARPTRGRLLPSERQCFAGLLVHQVLGVPVRPVRVALARSLLVLDVRRLRAPQRLRQVVHRPVRDVARDLADALRRASAAHGRHQARIGAADPNWPEWYAAHMVAEQIGEELPS